MLNLIFLQAATAAEGQQGNQWSFWIMMILIFVVLYFFMIRPQTKRQKELQRAKYKYNQSNWFMKLFRKKVNEPKFILPSDSALIRMGRKPPQKKKKKSKKK